MSQPAAVRIGPGVYMIDRDGQTAIVYVADSPDGRWAFSNGIVYRPETARAASSSGGSSPHSHADSLSAPMPATVVNVRAKAGTTVRNGDVLIVLEAMKMELLIRAPADGRVIAVHCREGDLVQPDTVLVDLET